MRTASIALLISTLFTTSLWADCTQYYADRYDILDEAQFSSPEKIITNEALHKTGEIIAGIGFLTGAVGISIYLSMDGSPESGTKDSPMGKFLLKAAISGGIATLIGGTIYFLTQKKLTAKQIKEMKRKFFVEISKEKSNIEEVLLLANYAGFLTPISELDYQPLLFQQVVSATHLSNPALTLEDVVEKFTEEYASETFCSDDLTWSPSDIRNYLVKFFSL